MQSELLALTERLTAYRFVRKLEHMGLAEVKERLRTNLPLSMTYNGQNQVFHLGDKSVELSGSPSDEQIAAALASTPIAALPPVDFAPQPQQANRMSITGLQQGAFQAKLADMRKRIADSQTSGLAKIDAVVADGEKKLEAAASDVAKSAQAEVDNALHEFAQFTNGPQS